MLTINNTANCDIYDHMSKYCWLEMWDDSQINDVMRALEPMQYEYFMKVNTPLYYVNDDSVISEKYRNEFRRSLFYVSKCVNDVSANIKMINTNDFNSEYVSYHHREFGYVANPKDKFIKRLKDMCFSKSSLRCMAVKSEIALFMYYHAKTLLDKLEEDDKKKEYTQIEEESINDEYEEDSNNNNEEEQHKEDSNVVSLEPIPETINTIDPLRIELETSIHIIIGAIKYALSRRFNFQDNITGEIKFKAVYLWELSTFISAFADLTIADEHNFNIPFKHVFEDVHRHEYISEFGDFNPQYILHNNIRTPFTLLLDEKYGKTDTFGGHFSMLPRGETIIDYDPSTSFYIPIPNIIVDECTDSFLESLSEFANAGSDLRLKCKALCSMTKYEGKHLLKDHETYADGVYFYFESEKDAWNYIQQIDISQFNPSKLYFSIMMKESYQTRRYSKPQTTYILRYYTLE